RLSRLLRGGQAVGRRCACGSTEGSRRELGAADRTASGRRRVWTNRNSARSRPAHTRLAACPRAGRRKLRSLLWGGPPQWQRARVPATFFHCHAHQTLCSGNRLHLGSIPNNLGRPGDLQQVAVCVVDEQQASARIREDVAECVEKKVTAK